METVVLMGAEEVAKAGLAIKEAGLNMQLAAADIREVFEATRRWHEEWEAAIDRLPAPTLSDADVARIGEMVARGREAPRETETFRQWVARLAVESDKARKLYLDAREQLEKGPGGSTACREEGVAPDALTGLGGVKTLIPMQPIPVIVGRETVGLYVERLQYGDAVPGPPGQVRVSLALVGSLPRAEARELADTVRRGDPPKRGDS